MKLTQLFSRPTIHHAPAAAAGTVPDKVTVSLQKRVVVCDTETGIYVNRDYHIALKLEEDCDSISSYDGAFKTCNATRESDTNYHNYYQVNHWNSDSVVLYANGTEVPKPLLDCLYKSIPEAVSANNKSDSKLIGEAVGGTIGGIVVLAGAFVGICWCADKCSRAARNRAQRHEQHRVQNRAQRAHNYPRDIELADLAPSYLR